MGSAQMQFIGELDGKRLHFADARFAEPGIYYWDGTTNVRVWPTQPPHQDRGEVAAFIAKWDWLILSRLKDEFAADLAALTEAKQQGPGEAVPAADGWEDWNDGDSSFLSVADSDARYEVSFAIHEGHSGVWRAYFNPDTEREPIKETYLGTFASKERAKKECEDHYNQANNYRDNDGGVPYVY